MQFLIDKRLIETTADDLISAMKIGPDSTRGDVKLKGKIFDGDSFHLYPADKESAWTIAGHLLSAHGYQTIEFGGKGVIGETRGHD